MSHPNTQFFGCQMAIGETLSLLDDGFTPGVSDTYWAIEDDIKRNKDHYGLPISRSEGDIEIRFLKLKEQWEQDTEFLSSISEISMHPAYQQIIGMGKEALPFIMQELVKSPSHWFWALRSITGENPVPQDKIGNLKKMTESWLIWWIRQKAK